MDLKNILVIALLELELIYFKHLNTVESIICKTDF